MLIGDDLSEIDLIWSESFEFDLHFMLWKIIAIRVPVRVWIKKLSSSTVFCRFYMTWVIHAGEAYYAYTVAKYVIYSLYTNC